MIVDCSHIITPFIRVTNRSGVERPNNLRLFFSLFMCLALFISGCMKEDIEKPDIRIVFDKIVAYPNDSIFTNFHVEIEPDDPGYIIEWSSPAYLLPDSIYSLSLVTDYTLKFVLKNSDRKELCNFEHTILVDTILTNPAYDFRNFYEGDYYYNIHHVYYSWSRPIGVDTIYFVNGYVEKSGPLYSSLLSFNYGPKILWTGYPLELSRYSTLVISPDNKITSPDNTGPTMFDPHLHGNFFNGDSLMITIGIRGPGGISDAIYIRARKLRNL